MIYYFSIFNHLDNIVKDIIIVSLLSVQKENVFTIVFLNGIIIYGIRNRVYYPISLLSDQTHGTPKNPV